MQTTLSSLDTEFIRIKTKRIVWGAIFAGIVMSLSVGVLLNLLGLGLGFTAFSPYTDTLASIGKGAIVWIIVSGIISMFIGGWMAGRLARTNLKMDGALHGLVTWGLGMLIAFVFMASSAGMIVSSTASIIGKSFTAVEENASSFQQTIAEADAQLDDNEEDSLPAPIHVTNDINKQRMQEVQTKAQQSVKQASNVAGRVAIVSFFVLLLGGIASTVGGFIGGGNKKVAYPVEEANHIIAGD